MNREMKLIPYDRKWANQFTEIKNTLTSIFGNLAVSIEHFGSTSIQGMSAKPIIDVMVIVENIARVDELNKKMITFGYQPKGENGIEGRRYFQMFDHDGVNHIQHIHCYEKSNQHVYDELMFRDYLRVNKKAFDAYYAVKTEASQKFRHSPSTYTEYKTACIMTIMKQAKQYYKKQI